MDTHRPITPYQSEPNRFEYLCGRVIHGELDHGESQELHAALSASNETRRSYCRQAILHVDLRRLFTFGYRPTTPR